MATPEFYSGKLLYPAIAVLLALSALFGLAILPRLGAPAGGLVGKAAPDVTLPVALNGDPGARMQISELKGHPVMLDFWASWCAPCAAEAPIIDRVARRYQKKGLVVLGIDIDDAPETARAAAAQKGLSYPILVDDQKRASALYGVETIPNIVMIDKQGNVKSVMTGPVDEGTLEEMVSAEL